MQQDWAKRLSGLWLAGLVLGLVVLSLGLSWRHLLFFMVLFGLLAWGRKSSVVRRFEAPLWLIVVGAVVLACFDENLPGSSFTARVWIGLLLVSGLFCVATGLLRLGWVRPVGGIVDITAFGFCLFFPIAVLGFQIFVHHYFSIFPIIVGVKGLAWRLLGAFAAYIMLSQFFLQDAAYRRKFRLLWIAAVIALGAIGVLRTTSLAKNILVLRQTQYEPGPVLDRARRQARRLDLRWARQVLAVQAALGYYREEAAEAAVAALREPVRFLSISDRERYQLEKSVGEKSLVTLAIGTGPIEIEDASFVAMTLDEREGQLFLVDSKARLYMLAQNAVGQICQLSVKPEMGDVQDLLFQEKSQSLLILFSSGTVIEYWVRWITHPQEELAAIPIPSQRSSTYRDSPARRLVAVPESDCVVIAFADFEIEPIIGTYPLPDVLKNREFRRGQDLLRGLCFLSGGEGGYIVDAFGGIHPFGNTPIGYPDLSKHSREKYHYWPGQDFARGIFCSADGTQLTVFDAFGGVHCAEKLPQTGRMHYFGSPRSYFDRPEIGDMIEAYDSCYLLHHNGRIDRREGTQRLFNLFRPNRGDQAGGIPPLILMMIFGWTLFRAPRRVPSRKSTIEETG